MTRVLVARRSGRSSRAGTARGRTGRRRRSPPTAPDVGVRRLGVQRPPQRAGPDTGPVQVGEQPVPTARQRRAGRAPSRASTSSRSPATPRRQLEPGARRTPRRTSRRSRACAATKLRQPLQLGDAERGRQVGQPVVVADLVVQVPVSGTLACVVRCFARAASSSSSVTSMPPPPVVDDLVAVERERADAPDRAGLPPGQRAGRPARAERLGGVLQHRDAVAPRRSRRSRPAGPAARARARPRPPWATARRPPRAARASRPSSVRVHVPGRPARSRRAATSAPW